MDYNNNNNKLIIYRYPKGWIQLTIDKVALRHVQQAIFQIEDNGEIKLFAKEGSVFYIRSNDSRCSIVFKMYGNLKLEDFANRKHELGFLDYSYRIKMQFADLHWQDLPSRKNQGVGIECYRRETLVFDAVDYQAVVDIKCIY